MNTIQLPYPVSANNLYHIVGRGKKKHLAKTVEYDAWRWECVNHTKGAHKLAEEPFSVSLEMVPPDHRRRDLDNLLKPVMDILKDLGLTPDDSLCVRIEARKLSPSKPGHITVTYEGVGDV